MKLFELMESAHNDQYNQVDKILTKHNINYLLTAEDMIKLCTNCSEYINSIDSFNDFNALYRGTSGVNAVRGISLMIPRKRKGSLTGNNTIMNLTSAGVIEEWTSFPDRSKSLFMTNNLTTAGDFGTKLTQCFPSNGANLGVTPKQSEDFNNDESWSYRGVFHISLFFIITELQEFINFEAMPTTEFDWDDIKQLSNTIDAKSSFKTIMYEMAKYGDSERRSALETMGDTYETLFDCMKDALNPIKNGFVNATPKTISQILSSDGTYREVWTDQTIYGVNRAEAPYILKAAKDVLAANLIN